MNDAISNLNAIVHQFVKCLLIKVQQARFGDGAYRGGAWFGIQQRHFAKQLAWPQAVQNGVPIKHFHTATDNDVEAVAPLTAFKDGGSSWNDNFTQSFSDFDQNFIGRFAEQIN